MSRRILLADDHEGIRQRVRSALEAAGFNVCGEAVDGADAIEKTKALLPALIVLNLSMPVMGGLDAIPEIAKSAPATKIIVFSVDEADALRQEALRRGAHGYVSKSSPVTVLMGASAIQIDSKQNAYFTGPECSSDFPVTPTAYQTSGSPDQCSAFLTQIDTSKSGNASLVYSTYLGGTSTGDFDIGWGMALDASLKVYVGGATYSKDFPITVGSANNGNGVLFAAKFDTAKSQSSSLIYSITVGGSNVNYGSTGGSIAVDANGLAYLAGWTSSPDFPITSGAIVSSLNGSSGCCNLDTTLTILNPNASILYSTFLCGVDCLSYGGASLDSSGNIYIAGTTDASNFPTTSGAFQTSFAGGGPQQLGGDGYIIKLTSGSWDPTITSLSPSEGPTGTSVTITGSNFGSSQGSSTLTFNGTVATSINAWTAASITATVPSGATTGDVLVTVSGVRNVDGHTFTVTSNGSGSPFISSLSPSQGAVGTTVLINGTNFGSSGTVMFNGVTANTSNWTATGITTAVPSGASTGDVIVTVSSVRSNAMDFTVTGSGGTNTSDIYFYFSDALGTSRVTTASDGTVCYDADSYPFGGERAYKDNCDSAYKFTGKERDAESNLDNFGARYFTSGMGRFMSPDPLAGHTEDPQTLNRYVYVRDNPLSLTDPTGLDFYLSCQQQNNTCGKDAAGNLVQGTTTTTTDANGNTTSTSIQLS